MGEQDRAALDRLRDELAKLAEDGGAQSAGFLRSVLANMPVLCCCISPAGQLLYVNRTVPGLTQEDVIGHSIYEFVPEDRHDEARAAFGRVVATGEPDMYVGYGVGKVGPRSRYDNWLGPIQVDGRVVALTLITRDVSEEWEMQRQLRASEARLRLALDASGMGMWRFDRAQDVVEIDERTRVMYRASERLFSPSELAEFVHPDDLERVRAEALRVLEHGGRYQLESRIVRGDGTTGWIAGTGVQVRGEDGALAGMIGTLLDITERRALEHQLRQAQKLEAVGQLTAGIAHNFNNMLASILPTLELVQEDVSPRNQEVVRAAKEAARRAAQMVRELLAFGGKRVPARTAVSIEEVLERVLSICRTTFDRAIAIESIVSPDLPSVLIDAPQIEQALINVLINARDAVRSEGVASPRVRIRVDRAPGPDGEPMVRLTIRDNGPGMTTDVRDRVFEPFFTTKEVGRGTGLGLSTSYGILRDHGGALRCESEPGAGATMTMWLPTTEDAPRPLESPAAVHTAPRAGRAVLLVDDEAVVRATTRRVLEDAGYLVREAADGAEALERLGEECALVLLDLNMPGPPWADVLGAIRERRPDARVVAFTGELNADAIDGFDAVVHKPAEPAVLIEAVEATLAD